MAVQLITNKKITKFDINSPNYKPLPVVEEVIDGNVIEENMYGEQKHDYVPEPNGNLQMEQMMGKILNKLDNVGTNDKSQTGIAPIEIDIKREIAISMVDQNAVKSEVTRGRVKTKKDKLRKLRRRR